MIAIIDYGAGNLSSVQKALNFLGADNRITADPAEILAADRVILPGVGAFGDAMAAMRSRGLVDTVRAAAADRFWVFAWGCNCCLPRAKKAPALRAWVSLTGAFAVFPVGLD